MIDLEISGSWGLYAIDPVSKRGKRWAAKHLSQDFVLDGAVMCEGGDRCRAIVAGAVAAGLKVEVNGTDMKGYTYG